MSSAILYLAIIAIWACVLIPRWLRRDTSRTASAREEHFAEPAVAVDSAAPDDVDEADEGHDDSEDAGVARPREGGQPAASGEDTRRRVLAARRRLLWMLLGLQAAGAALAATGLAAWWVIAPPTVMLGGYLLLLREAAVADSERAAAERAAAQERAAARGRAQAKRAREREQARQAAAPAAYAAAPVADDYEDLGRARDFTPGLRHSAPGSANGEGAYDQYTENRLRAVGD